LKILRIENIDGEVSLITDQGEIIPADVVTIKMKKGKPTAIKAESKETGERFGSYTRFYANATTAP